MLHESGFQHSKTDFLFMCLHRGSDIAYLLLYVDDIILTASSSAFLQRIITSLHSEFAMTDLGSLNYFLGISAQRSATGLFLSQSKFAEEILEQAHMQNCNPVCLYMHDPRDPHFTALKRILCYVRGTLDYGLQLHVIILLLSLLRYNDADLGWCPGYSSVTLSLSSAEAEYEVLLLLLLCDDLDPINGMIIRLSMTLGNKKTVDDAAFEIAPDANKPNPSPVEDADLPSLDAHLQIAPHPNTFCNPSLVNWNWDEVILILSDDDEANVNEPIALPIKDADVEIAPHHNPFFNPKMTNTIVTTPVNVTGAPVTNITAPQVEPPKEGKLSNAQAVQAVEAWKHGNILTFCVTTMF
ncbi:ribonuclease H-like domain-containing protein [Tanacetum coccineum]